MSDTKQQCPQCGSENRKNRLAVDSTGVYGVFPPKAIECTHPWHDSPVEGSGEPTSSGDGSSGRAGEIPSSGLGTQRETSPDSPSAAGSGARECAIEVLTNCAAHYTHPKSFRWDNPQEAIDMAVDNATKIISAYADHCTAQLRQQVDDLRRQRDLEWDSRKRAQSELTAECTRREAAEAQVKQDGWYLVYADRLTSDGKKYGRDGEVNHGGNCLAWYEHAVFWRNRAEAAERERDELLEAARKVVKFWNTNDGYFGDLRAALRGKGE